MTNYLTSLLPQQDYAPNDLRYGLAGLAQNPQSGASGSGGLPTYNSTPSPTIGNSINNGPYGSIPGPTAIPPSNYQQAMTAAPGLGSAQTQLTNNIMSELQGQISPQVLKNLQDAAARFGVSSGMPGSNATPGTLAFNQNMLGNLNYAGQQQALGAQQFNQALGTIGGQQLNPSLAAEISQSNAQLAAAPNPTAAANQQLQNYWNALNALKGPAGGSNQGLSPSGGTGQQAGSGALGFGFNSLGQPQQPIASLGLGSSAAPWTAGPTPGTSPWSAPDLSGQSAWDFTDPNNWNFDLGGSGTGLDTSGLGPVATTDPSNPDYWNLDLGQG